MKKHFTIAHPEEEIPEVAILSEAEQNLIKKRKVFEKTLYRKQIWNDWKTKSLPCCL